MAGLTFVSIPRVAPRDLADPSDARTPVDNGERARARAMRPVAQMVRHLLGARPLALAGTRGSSVGSGTTKVWPCLGAREPYAGDLAVWVVIGTSAASGHGIIRIVMPDDVVETPYTASATDSPADAHSYAIVCPWGTGRPGDLGDVPFTVEVQSAVGEAVVYGIGAEPLPQLQPWGDGRLLFYV